MRNGYRIRKSSEGLMNKPYTAGYYAKLALSRILDQQPDNREKFKKFGSLAKAGKRGAQIEQPGNMK